MHAPVMTFVQVHSLNRRSIVMGFRRVINSINHLGQRILTTVCTDGGVSGKWLVVSKTNAFVLLATSH